MSLLSKKNKLDTIHLDYDVQVIPIGEFETNLKESITDEITKFIKEHILRVLSDRKYATKQLRDIWKRFTDYGRANSILIIIFLIVVVYLSTSYNDFLMQYISLAWCLLLLMPMTRRLMEHLQNVYI